MFSRLLGFCELALAFSAVAAAVFSLAGSHLAMELLSSLTLSAYVISLHRAVEKSSRPRVLILEAVAVFLLFATPYYLIVLVHVHTSPPLSLALLASMTLGLLLASADTRDAPRLSRTARVVASAAMWSLAVSTSVSAVAIHEAMPALLAATASLALLLVNPLREAPETGVYGYRNIWRNLEELEQRVSVLADSIVLLSAGIRGKASLLTPRVLLEKTVEYGDAVYEVVERLSILSFHAIVYLTSGCIALFEKTVGWATREAWSLEEAYRRLYERVVGFLQLVRLVAGDTRVDLSQYVLITLALVTILLLVAVALAR